MLKNEKTLLHTCEYMIVLAHLACIRKLDPVNHFLILSAVPWWSDSLKKRWYQLMRTSLLVIHLHLNMMQWLSDVSRRTKPIEYGFPISVWPECVFQSCPFSSLSRGSHCNGGQAAQHVAGPIAFGYHPQMRWDDVGARGTVLDESLLHLINWFQLFLINASGAIWLYWTVEGYPKSKDPRVWLHRSSYSFGECQLQQGRVLRRNRTSNTP